MTPTGNGRIKGALEMSVAPPVGQNRIMIYGPKDDGTYIVEFRTAAGEALAISIPRTEAAVVRHFQERMPLRAVRAGRSVRNLCRAREFAKRSPRNIILPTAHAMRVPETPPEPPFGLRTRAGFSSARRARRKVFRRSKSFPAQQWRRLDRRVYP